MTPAVVTGLLKRADLPPGVPPPASAAGSATGRVEAGSFNDRLRTGSGFALAAGVGTGLANLGYRRLYGPGGLTEGHSSRADLESLARHAGLDPASVELRDAPRGNASHQPGWHSDSGEPAHFINVPMSGTGTGGLQIDVNPGTLAHELGHGTVTDFMHRRMGGRHAPVVWRMAGRYGMFGSGLAAIGAGMGSGNMVAAGTALAVPLLVDELAASHFGGRAMMRHLRPAGFTGKARAYLSAYRGVPTYLAAASAPALAYGLNRLVSRWRGESAGKDTPSLLKRADLLPGVELQPHQKRVADEAAAGPVRKLLYHSLGSGKTLTSLAAAETRGEPYTAVTPASLRANYRGEQEKFTDRKVPSTLMSYTQLGAGRPTPDAGTVIFDEAHRLRNPGSAQSQRARELAHRARQLVLLSGTPIVNHPSDLAPLVSMLRDKDVTPAEFSQRYVGSRPIYPGLLRRLMGVTPGQEPTVQNPEELRALLRGHVDYYDPGRPVVPTQYEDVHVEMGPEQSQLYNAMWGRLPWFLRWKLQHDFPLSQGELSRAMSFLTGPRQVSLSTYPYRKDGDPHAAFRQSPKLRKAMELLQAGLASNPQTKALVFSNFIDAGLTPYSAALARANVPHGVFSGKLSDAQRKKLVEDYNSGKIRVALLGPSGTEGLSFKGTQLIQQLDPYWNPIRGRQAVGRGLRYDSHWGLPEDLQNVKVQRFVSRLPLGLVDRLLAGVGFNQDASARGADDHLRAIEARKARLNQQFLDLLKEVGSQ